MSASYRRPPGSGGEPSRQDPYESYDPYAAAEPATDPSSLSTLSDLRPDPRTEQVLYAPARGTAFEKPKGTSPIVPAGSVTSRALTMVVTIMCFLACLTAGAVYMMNQSASAWMRDIASEVTVQVEPRERVDTDRTMKDVTAFLAQQPGIVSVRPLSLDSAASLIEPWLGSSDALKALPIPRLIAVEVDRDRPADLRVVAAALAKQFPGVSLDDHSQWQQQIRTLTRSFALGGIAILALVGAATTAIIITATRSAIAANREIVEVLHFVGATDRFIAREFEKQFLTLGVRAGLVGAVLAMAVFVSMPYVMELLGSGTASLNEFNRLVGTGSLDPAGYALLALVVVVIAALCMLTSRISVFRILHSKG